MRERLGLGNPLLKTGARILVDVLSTIVAGGDVRIGGLSSAIALPSTVGGNEGHFMYFDTSSSFIL